MQALVPHDEPTAEIYEQPLGEDLIYLRELVAHYPGIWGFNSNTGHIFNDLVAHLPSIQNLDLQRRKMCHRVAETVYPLVANLYAKSVSLTLTVVSIPQTPEILLSTLATYTFFDAESGWLRHIFVSPHHAKPDAKALAIVSGLIIRCEPLNYHPHRLRDDRKRGTGPDPGFFGWTRILVNQWYDSERLDGSPALVTQLPLHKIEELPVVDGAVVPPLVATTVIKEVGPSIALHPSHGTSVMGTDSVHEAAHEEIGAHASATAWVAPPPIMQGPEPTAQSLSWPSFTVPTISHILSAVPTAAAPVTVVSAPATREKIIQSSTKSIVPQDRRVLPATTLSTKKGRAEDKALLAQETSEHLVAMEQQAAGAASPHIPIEAVRAQQAEVSHIQPETKVEQARGGQAEVSQIQSEIKIEPTRPVQEEVVHAEFETRVEAVELERAEAPRAQPETRAEPTRPIQKEAQQTQSKAENEPPKIARVEKSLEMGIKTTRPTQTAKRTEVLRPQPEVRRQSSLDKRRVEVGSQSKPTTGLSQKSVSVGRISEPRITSKESKQTPSSRVAQERRIAPHSKQVASKSVKIVASRVQPGVWQPKAHASSLPLIQKTTQVGSPKNMLRAQSREEKLALAHVAGLNATPHVPGHFQLLKLHYEKVSYKSAQLLSGRAPKFVPGKTPEVINKWQRKMTPKPQVVPPSQKTVQKKRHILSPHPGPKTLDEM